MTEDALAARRPLWAALGQLFADSDTRMFYPHILRAWMQSPYTIEETGKILQDEVVPGLLGMAFSLYPPWHGLDDEWVIAQVEKNLGRRRWLPRLIDLSQEWRSLAILMERLQSLPDDAAREQRLEIWHDLLPLFLDRNPLPRQKWATHNLSEYESAWREDLCPAMMEMARTLEVKWPGRHPTEAEIEANWREFAAGRF